MADTTPPEQLLTDEQRSTLAAQHGFEYNPSGGVAGLIAAIEHALLAKLREQQPFAWALGLPHEPPQEHALWSTKPSPEDVRFAEVQFDMGGLVVTPLYAAPVPTPAAQAAQAVPAGWKMVPVEPTIGMLMAGIEARISERHPRHFEAAYAAMLAAAPTPTGAGDEGGAR